MSLEIPSGEGNIITLEQAQREILRLLDTESEIVGMSLFEKRVSEYYKKKNSEKEKREGVADYALVASKNFRREMIESWFRKFSDAEFKLLDAKIESLWLKVMRATVKKPGENKLGEEPKGLEQPHDKEYKPKNFVAKKTNKFIGESWIELSQPRDIDE